MSDWVRTALGELVDMRKGVKVEVFDEQGADAAPYLGAGSLEAGRSRQWASTQGGVLAERTDVLMLWDGERSGLTGGGLEGVVASTVSRLRPRGIVDSAYLRHALQAKFPWIQAQRTGTGVPHVPKDLGNWLMIRHPESIAEQRRIAEILDTLDGQIRITHSVITKIALAKSALYQRFFDDPHLPRVPLGDVAEVRNGTTPSRARPDYWERGSIAWLTSGKVNDYRIQSASELVTERAVSESNLRILPAGSVVIGMIGQGKTRGMSARVDIDAAINQNLAGVIPGPALRGDFLHHYLVHNYQKLRSGGRGSNQDALTTRLVSQFLVACPDLDIQAQIARLLGCADQRLENERGLVAKLDRQKDGLLSDLLTGRVRVAKGSLS